MTNDKPVADDGMKDTPDLPEISQKSVPKVRGGNRIKEKYPTYEYILFQMPNKKHEWLDEFAKLAGFTSSASFIADELPVEELDAKLNVGISKFDQIPILTVEEYFDAPFKFEHPDRYEFLNDARLKDKLFSKIQYNPAKDKNIKYSIDLLKRTFNKGYAEFKKEEKNMFKTTKPAANETKEIPKQNYDKLIKEILYKGGIFVYGVGCLGLVYLGVTSGGSCSSNLKSDLEKRTETLIQTEAKPLTDKKEALKYQLDQKVSEYNNSPELSDKITELNLLTNQGKETQELYQIALNDFEQAKIEYSALEPQLNEKIAAVEQQYAALNLQTGQNDTSKNALNGLIEEKNKIQGDNETLETELEAAFKEKSDKTINDRNKRVASYKTNVTKLVDIDKKLTILTEQLGKETYNK